MTFLYVGTKREASERTLRLLHGTAPNCKAEWSQTVQSALRWLHENRRASAAVLGADVSPLSCASFLDQVRELRLTAVVIVVVAPDRLEETLSLSAGADGYVVDGPRFDDELRRVVAAALDRQRCRQEGLALELTELKAGQDQLARRVARAEEARRLCEQRRASELASAAVRLADLQADHSASLAREARICTALQQRLLEAEAAGRKAAERRASDIVAFAGTLAKEHEEFLDNLAQTARARDALAAQLTVVRSALDQARQERRADTAAAAEQLRRRDAEAAAALAEAAAARGALDETLARRDVEERDARQRWEADLAAANERQAALDDLLAQEVERRAALDRDRAALEAALREAEERHAAELTEAVTRVVDVQARYEAAQRELDARTERFAHREAELGAQAVEAGAAKLALERALDDVRGTLGRDLEGARSDLARGRRRLLYVASAYRTRAREDKALLAATQEQLQRLHRAIDEERQAYESARAISESELQRLSTEHGQLGESFEQLQGAFQTLERIAREHAAERARLELVVADRDAALREQAERHGAAEQAARTSLADVQERLRESTAATASEIARLTGEVTVQRAQLDAARAHAEALQADAGRVPDLETRLDASEKERRRQFERAPYALCRCTPEGVITDANHSFVALLGRRRADEVRNMEFAAAVSDSAGDLGWLFESTRGVRKTETLETAWKTLDGRHLAVRLNAFATAAGAVEIVVEDVTSCRALEERLRRAQRMEAVGRLAVEVAATCEALLRGVTRDAGEWHAARGDDEARRRGEEVLFDLTRAASFLRQLDAFGTEQARALEPVDVQRVARDLAPVLQHVAGDSIELVVSKAAGAFHADVDAERLERVLVNVAGYARERMPHGGQLKIDVTTTAVGRRAVAQYPHVRPGPHVLLTAAALPTPGDRGEGRAASERPGVELAALADLVASCGGHLWMDAQPEGIMVLKIHLPKGAADATERARPGVRADRGGRLARWLRSTSASVMGS